jgi:CRP-like cAMP-binding protein
MARFSEFAEIEMVKPGNDLFVQGDPAGNVFIIRSGQVKVVHQHPDGTLQILRVAGAGEILGLAMLSNGTMMTTATTRNGASICRSRLSDIENLLRTDPDFALAWAHLLQDEIRRAREGLLHLGPHPAAVRLARFLLRSMSENGSSPGNAGTPPVVSLTHADLAAALSIAHETATRLLRDMEEKGMVRLARGRIEILDPDRLLALGGYPGSVADLEARD